MKILKKLRHSYIWKRIFIERLTEPFHLNILSLFIFFFGTYKQKIKFDLIIRSQHAFGLLFAAENAKKIGFKEISVCEFGVANGAGLINICNIAKRITEITSIKINIYGFDTGKGMPISTSYMDHPELYNDGDFPMNKKELLKILPENCQLIIGDVKKTLPKLLKTNFKNKPFGFISIDLDYYSSTKDALRIFKFNNSYFLPYGVIYFDDIDEWSHNSKCGELAALLEFNKKNPYLQIEKNPFLKHSRVMKNQPWIDHTFFFHILKHPVRNNQRNRKKIILDNPFI